MDKLYKILLFVSALMTVSRAVAQTEQYITIEGEVSKPMRLTVQDMSKFPAAEVQGKDKAGKEHTYQGTLLSTVLDNAGVTLGKELRGVNLARYVQITAADNYKVVYALAEVGPEFSSNTILLATSIDGRPLPKGEGPFRIVATQDKKHGRWIREVTSIKVVSAKQE